MNSNVLFNGMKCPKILHYEFTQRWIKWDEISKPGGLQPPQLKWRRKTKLDPLFLQIRFYWNTTNCILNVSSAATMAELTICLKILKCSLGGLWEEVCHPPNQMVTFLLGKHKTSVLCWTPQILSKPWKWNLHSWTDVGGRGRQSPDSDLQDLPVCQFWIIVPGVTETDRSTPYPSGIFGT